MKGLNRVQSDPKEVILNSESYLLFITKIIWTNMYYSPCLIWNVTLNCCCLSLGQSLQKNTSKQQILRWV